MSLSATGVSAQTGPQPPAETFSISPGGVDMRTGRFAIDETDLSIGEDSESGGLALNRILSSSVAGHLDAFGNMTHNWDIFIITKNVDLLNGNYEDGSGPNTRAEVNFGGRSETFDSENPTAQYFVQLSRANLARLSVTGSGTSALYMMTASDGTQIKFRPIGNKDCSNAHSCAYASQIIYPDGTVIDLSYENPSPGTPNGARLRRVQSSRGFAMLFEYGSGATWNYVTKACAVNLAVSPAPANNVCGTSSLASVSYTYTYFTPSILGRSPSYRLSTFTDAENGAYNFGYTNSGGNIVMSFTKPGQSVPWLTNTLAGYYNPDFGMEEITTAQQYADGQAYTYYFDQIPEQNGILGQGIAGGRYSDALGNWTHVRFGIIPNPNSFISPVNRPTVCSSGAPIYQRVEMDDPVYTTIYQPGPDGGEIAVTIEHPNTISIEYVTAITSCFPDIHLDYGEISYQITPGPVEVEDPLGRVWKSNYCDPVALAGYAPSLHHRCLVTTLQWTEDPEGNRTEYFIPWSTRNVLRATRKAKPGSGLPDIVTSAGYSDCLNPLTCAKPLTVTDGNGNTTTYTYDQAHGGILSETGPAVNGVSPQVRNEYAQRYAWVKNAANNGYVQAATPSWVLVKEEFCKETAASGGNCAGGASDEVVTTYDYGPNSGPNNLLVRGKVVTADGQSLRTCYGYDSFGRRISETEAKADLVSCP